MKLPNVPKSMYRYLIANAFLIALGLGLVLGAPWSSAASIGSPIIASGVVGFIYYYYLKRERRYEKGIELADEWGLLEIHPDRRNRDRYQKALDGCQEKLHIQAISLRRFYDDFNHMLDTLKRRDVEVRLLLLNPESENLDWIAEGDPYYSDLQNRINQSAEDFSEINMDNLEVKFYNGLPQNYFRVDDRVFIGPYFSNISSRNTVTFLTEADKSLAEQYKQNFQDSWEEYSKPVDN